VRVNSGGTKLDASDLMFAAMKEGWADIRKTLASKRKQEDEAALEAEEEAVKKLNERATALRKAKAKPAK
jgi:hypothetical protein